jgi:cytosine/uracil/thiamine/allantoin permease
MGMASEDFPGRLGGLFPGKSGLIAAVAVVAVLLIGLPAYRLFFAVSVLLGLAIAGILYLWHKYKPVKEADVHDDKHPLGLG